MCTQHQPRSDILEGSKLLNHDIQLGTYLVVSLDAVRSYPGIFQGDIDQAPEILPSAGLYVGVVTNIWTSQDETAPALRLEVRLIGNGFPETQSMCVPIWPAVNHPAGRPAVQPSEPLPWPNSYHHSLMTVWLDVKTIDARNGSGIYISQDHVEYIKTGDLFDGRRVRYLRSLISSGVTGAMAPPSEVDYLGGVPDSDTDSYSISHFNTPHDHDRYSGDYPSTSESSHLSDESDFASNNLADPYFIGWKANVYLDLSLVSELPDPRGLFDEMKELARLIEYDEEYDSDETGSRIHSWLRDAQDLDPPLSPSTGLPLTGPNTSNFPCSPAAFVDPAFLEVSSTPPYRPFQYYDKYAACSVEEVALAGLEAILGDSSSLGDTNSAWSSDGACDCSDCERDAFLGLTSPVHSGFPSSTIDMERFWESGPPRNTAPPVSVTEELETLESDPQLSSASPCVDVPLPLLEVDLSPVFPPPEFSFYYLPIVACHSTDSSDEDQDISRIQSILQEEPPPIEPGCFSPNEEPRDDMKDAPSSTRSYLASKRNIFRRLQSRVRSASKTMRRRLRRLSHGYS